MGNKVPTTDVTRTDTAAPVLNSNFNALSNAFDDVLFSQSAKLNGTMDADSHPIINLPKASLLGSPVTYGQFLAEGRGDPGKDGLNGLKGDPGSNVENVAPFSLLKAFPPVIGSGATRVRSAEGWDYISDAEANSSPTGENVVTAPQDFTNAAWTAASTVVVAGMTVTDNSATINQRLTQTLPGKPVGQQSARINILKDAVPRATRFVGLRIATTGTGGGNYDLVIDTSTGEVEPASTAVAVLALDDYSVIDVGTYWQISLTLTPAATVTGWSVTIFPSMGASNFVEYSSAATGSATLVGPIEVFAGKPRYTERWPEISFRSADGRGWRLNTLGVIQPQQFGLNESDTLTDPAVMTANTKVLQRYFDFISQYNCLFMDMSVRPTIWTNNTLRVGKTAIEPATKVLRGKLSLRSTTAGECMVRFRWQRNVVANCFINVRGGDAAFSSRNILHGVIFDNCRSMDWSAGGIIPYGFRFAGVCANVGNNSFMNLKATGAFYCGSGANDSSTYSVTGTWTRNSTSNTTSSADNASQYSRLNVTALPPEDCQVPAGNTVVWFPGVGPRLLVAIDRVNSTIDVFPWLPNSVAESTTLVYIFGAALYIANADANAMTISVEAQLCGQAFATDSLYGATVNRIGAQFCGIGHNSGMRKSGVHQGDVVPMAYFEGNRVDVSRANGQNGDTPTVHYSMMLESADPNKCWTYIPMHDITTGQLGPFDGFVDCTLMIGRRRAVYEKRSPDNWRKTSDSLDLTPNDKGIYIGETEVGSRTLRILTSLLGARRNLGYSGGRYEASGTGPNNAPTGTITFTAQGGVLINGAASASFSRFDGPALFSYEWEASSQSWRVHLLAGKGPGAVTTVYDPPALAAGALDATQSVTVTGAALGDFVDVSFSVSLVGARLEAWVSAANTVQYRFSNPTGTAIDLTSGTVRLRLRKA